VASLSLEELRALVKEDEREAVVPTKPRPRPAVGTISQLLSDSIDAVLALDRQRLEQTLRDATVAFTPAQVRRELLVPLMQHIGERWLEGSLRIVHEHLASSVVRSFLTGITSRPVEESAPVIIATTPSGQRHELGILLASAAAIDAGWDVLYLGPDLPAEEIAAAAVQRRARAVMLSIVFPAGDPHLPEQLQQLRRYLGKGFPVFFGGRSARSYDQVISEIEGVVVDDLNDLQTCLNQARG
jgi:methanogenic corrinoid protein MtbC1